MEENKSPTVATVRVVKNGYVVEFGHPDYMTKVATSSEDLLDVLIQTLTPPQP